MEKIDFFEMSKNTPLKNIPNMPIGVSSFEKIRKDGSYYVDKTNLIKDIVESSYAVNLFTRPRRFGKTLIMRMLESFFSIEKNSKNFFDGLNISKNTQLCNATARHSAVRCARSCRTARWRSAWASIPAAWTA